jgi:lipopolysaccharide transport protein LptA
LINAFQAPIILAALIWTIQTAAANEHTAQGVKKLETKSIRITADKLIAKMDAAEIDFIGNVKALQAGAVITSDRLKIIYDPDAVRHKDGSPMTETIRKIIASGRVKIVTENITAEADTAEYIIESAILVLTGEPSRLTRDGHLITGSKFTLQRSDGTLIVEGSGEDRVKAIFQP